MDAKNLLLTIEDQIATITINRPEKLNALNAETITELFQAVKKLRQDDKVSVIIITGSGDKAFVAGADIAEISRHDEISGRIFATRGQRVFRYLEKLEKPVIAPHVENAESMAVLFQCGFDYIQGNFLQEPDIVMQFDFGDNEASMHMSQAAVT